ncbi:hypothetical protein QJQ45_004524 [Haematococcus lacustris]|nr:hypothetical protein QJQ45_004524 [Haematococcus lacustris]
MPLPTSTTPPPPSSAQSPAVLVEAKQESASYPSLGMFQLLGVHDSPTAKQMRTSYLSSSYSKLKKKVAAVVEQLLLVQQIAKTLGDCHKISSALDIAQLEVYGELRGLSANIDTRFATLFTICKDIRRSKDLTAEQQQDVKLVVARLAEVAPYAATEELDEFEMGAWDPDMTRGANITLRMTKVYDQSKFPILAKAAMRFLSVHVSTCAAERNWSAWRRTFADAHRNILSIEKAEELVFIQANDELSNCNQRDQAKELAIELY